MTPAQNASEFQTWKSRPQLIHMQYAMLNEASGSSDAPRLAKWQSIVMALQLSEEQRERLLAARTYLLAQMMEIIQERTLIISMLQVRPHPPHHPSLLMHPNCVSPFLRMAPACAATCPSLAAASLLAVGVAMQPCVGICTCAKLQISWETGNGHQMHAMHDPSISSILSVQQTGCLVLAHG